MSKQDWFGLFLLCVMFLFPAIGHHLWSEAKKASKANDAYRGRLDEMYETGEALTEANLAWSDSLRTIDSELKRKGEALDSMKAILEARLAGEAWVMLDDEAKASADQLELLSPTEEGQ